MAVEADALRDWHRLFGLLLLDFFTDSPFSVEVERDLSEQQQFLDVVILRQGRGRFRGRLPDGLDGLADHNLITFKSHHEALSEWAMKELIHHYVSYRKLVSPSPNDPLPEDRFRLHAVCARFPHNLSGQVPWREIQPGVYNCRWGTDDIRVIVTGTLPREPHNAPLHLFSASPALIDFGRQNYGRRSQTTSLVLERLLRRFQGEGFDMTFTMADFRREYFKGLTPEERMAFLEVLPPDEQRQLLERLPAEQFQKAMEKLPPEELQKVVELLPPEKLQALGEAIRQRLERRPPPPPSPSRKRKRKP